MKSGPTHGSERALRAPTILLAEDDADLRRLLSRSLVGKGCEVVEARNGWELEERAAELHAAAATPCALVADIHMPGIDGIAVVRLVRSWGWEIPILLMTAFPSDQKLASATRAGATVVLAKPFSIGDLTLAVSWLLRTREPAPSADHETAAERLDRGGRRDDGDATRLRGSVHLVAPTGRLGGRTPFDPS